MCGRFVLNVNQESFQDHFNLNLPDQDFINYNITPTAVLPIIHLNRHQEKNVTSMVWGLHPSWAKTNATFKPLINARVETIEDKPSFRESFKKRRCLIPVSGFYEWHDSVTPKQPYYIYDKGINLMAFAGIWETSSKSDHITHTFAIITQQASDTMAHIHHRQPLILKQNQYDDWLSQQILPHEPLNLSFHAVSTDVNSPKNNSSKLIEPMGQAPV